MTADHLTCARVDEKDLDLRYLTGRLSDQEAEAFEAHYFTCDRCWALVQQGAPVRAVRLPPAPAAARQARRRPSTYRLWLPLALAAGLAALAFGLWPRQPPAFPSDGLRGDTHTLPVRIDALPATLGASWPPVRDAGRYRVRLHRPDGGLVMERETSDTSISLSRDSLALRPDDSTLFWLVEALSRTGTVVARSPLVPQRLSPTGP